MSDNLMDDLLDDVSPEDAGDALDGLEVEIDDLPQHLAEVVDQLERERDDAVESRQRALADYANFQRRAAENEKRAYANGAADLIRLLIPALDHFDLALNQDFEQTTAEQLAGGVNIARQEMMKALHDAGVERINPQIGAPLDPNRHAAMLRLASEDIEPNHIVQVLQPGYARGDIVLRAAQVAVAAGE